MLNTEFCLRFLLSPFETRMQMVVVAKGVADWIEGDSRFVQQIRYLSDRMTVNYHLEINKLCAKKLKMQRNEENARASTIAMAAIGGELHAEDGDDDDSSRDAFAVKAVMVPDDGTNGSYHGSSITKEGGRGVTTWFVDYNGTPYDSPYEKEYSAETNEELFQEVSDFFDSLKVFDPTQDTEHLNFAKNRLRDFKTYSNTVENSFITAVCCAQGKFEC